MDGRSEIDDQQVAVSIKRYVIGHPEAADTLRRAFGCDTPDCSTALIRDINIAMSIAGCSYRA